MHERGNFRNAGKNDTAVRVPFRLGGCAAAATPGTNHVIRRFLVLVRGGQLGQGLRAVTLFHLRGSYMKARRFIGLATLIVAVIPVAALARDCNEVRAEIDSKITAKGVTNYVLEIVDAQNVKEEKIVGTCAGGAKQIVYRKQTPGEPNKLALEEKPAAPKKGTQISE